MTTKHTPGPWAINEYGSVIEASTGRDVLFRSISTVSAGDKVDEAESNTDLLAVAPELFELLRQAVGGVRHLARAANLNVDEWVAWNDKAADVIAKARGGQAMANKISGAPAFQVQMTQTANGLTCSEEPGMTLRQYAAIQVASGLAANASLHDMTAEQIALESILTADKLIERLAEAGE